MTAATLPAQPRPWARSKPHRNRATTESSALVFIVAAVSASAFEGQPLAAEQLPAATLSTALEDGAVVAIVQDPKALPETVARLRAKAAGTAGSAAGATERVCLTPREKEVVDLAARGCSNSEIATLLTMSAHTVHSHFKNAYRKLAVRSRGEAVFEATRLGLINPHAHGWGVCVPEEPLHRTPPGPGRRWPPAGKTRRLQQHGVNRAVAVAHEYGEVAAVKRRNAKAPERMGSVHRIAAVGDRVGNGIQPCCS